MKPPPQPPAVPNADPLERLAAAWGIATSYHDAGGVLREASPESLRAVLEAMGAPIRGGAGVEEALHDLEEPEATGACEPVAVAWNGRLPPIAVRRGAHATHPPALATATLELEAGGTIELPGAAAARAAAGTPAEGAALFELRPGEPIPLGAHRLVLELDEGEPIAVHVLSAPERCFGAEQPARRLCLFAPVHALRSQRTPPGAPGDLGDLARLRDWALPLGVDSIGVLPLLASFLDEPFDPSPYSPVSRLFWNELYLDLTLAPELASSPRAAELVEAAAGRSAAQLRAAPATIGREGGAGLVDYRAAMAARRQALDALSTAAFAEPARRAEIEAFARAEPALEDYARFRATAERQRAGWPAWPAALRDGALGPGDYDEAARRRHLYAQWLWNRQFEELFADGEQLYLDLPIGVNGGGFDVWRFRDQFAPGASVGAPPDGFFAAGQDWGFPPPHPRRGRLTGHAHFRSVVAAHLRRGAMLRLDHVMALHRLFWIPPGADARDGVYVRYPADELYAVLALESHRHHALVIGENLGTVPPEVHEGMRRRGLRPMRILQFELAPEWPATDAAPALQGLAALNTHDTATFAAFWEGADVDLRLRLGLLEPEAAKAERARRGEIRRAVETALGAGGWLGARHAEGERPTGEVLHALLRWLAASGAETVVVQLEDLWLELEPMNVPGVHWEEGAESPLGTGADPPELPAEAGAGDGVSGHEPKPPAYPSWRRTLERTLESITADPTLAGALRELAALRRAGR